MSHQILQKTYPGETARPSVQASFLSTERLGFVITPWGGSEIAAQVTSLVKEYYTSSISDPEATTPFATIPGLSPTANGIRVATLLANDAIYEKFNRLVYSSACEALVFALNRFELSWVHIGQPHMLLLRNGRLSVIQAGNDLSNDYMNTSPLPAKLLGVDRQIELETKNMIMQPEDKIIVLAHANIPPPFFSAKLAQKSASVVLETLFNAAVKDQPKAPFWIGIIDPF